MAINNYNIRQFSSADLSTTDNRIQEHSIKQIKTPGETKQVSYCTINLTKTKDGLNAGQVLKFGYVCEPKGISYPIYIDGIEIQMGKNCIYECQNEDFFKKKVDETTGAITYESQTYEIKIQKVEVPEHITFTIDYVTVG